MNLDEQQNEKPQRQEPRFAVGPQLQGPAPIEAKHAAKHAGRVNDLPRSVELHIEELVLHGFAPGDRYRIGEAVERELFRLMTERGVPPSLAGGDASILDAGEFIVERNSAPEEIGLQVARAVYGGLSK